MTGLLTLDGLVAIAPVLILLLLFEWLDVFHLMGWRETAGVLLLGALAGISAYPVSGRLLDAMPMGFSFYSRFVAPWIEEALKGAAILVLFARNRIGFKLDAAISGFAVGAGFSVVENVFYLERFGHLALGVWMVRGLGTAIMHGATGATFAIAAHQLNERDARRPGVRWRLHPAHYLPGYLVAVAEHVLFNQFPDRPQLAMLTILIVAPLVVLLVFRFGIREAEGWLAAEAQEHRQALEALRAGRYPQSEPGRLIEALAERLSGRTPADAIRAYLQVQTEIALRAEEMLGAEAAGHRTPFADAILFDRQRALRDQLGRTTLALLAPVMPFSRNELWEMRELERKAGRRHDDRPARG
ncbi:PrsW family glutamic-type intramembrane protease [uncultured Sphingomonas sp.]|uniref:PrsW family glutamic-type intramembrane protease n=1 Tax=uncultured Sphingomonas sp. TaxID=158754 RepID=UPI0035CC19E6